MVNKNLIIIILILGIEHSAYAGECFSPSPVKRLGGDIYEPPSGNNIDGGNHAQVKSFFQKLEGKWRGSGHELDCRGTKKNIKSKWLEKEINLDVRLGSSDRIDFSASIKDIKFKSKNRKRFQIRKNGNTFGVTGENSTTIKLSQNSEMSIHTHYVIGKSGPLRIGMSSEYAVKSHEIIRKFEQSGNKLKVTIRRFLEGELIQEEEWSLNKE